MHTRPPPQLLFFHAFHSFHHKIHNNTIKILHKNGFITSIPCKDLHGHTQISIFSMNFTHFHTLQHAQAFITYIGRLFLTSLLSFPSLDYAPNLLNKYFTCSNTCTMLKSILELVETHEETNFWDKISKGQKLEPWPNGLGFAPLVSSFFFLSYFFNLKRWLSIYIYMSPPTFHIYYLVLQVWPHVPLLPLLEFSFIFLIFPFFSWISLLGQRRPSVFFGTL